MIRYGYGLYLHAVNRYIIWCFNVATFSFFPSREWKGRRKRWERGGKKRTFCRHARETIKPKKNVTHVRMFLRRERLTNEKRNYNSIISLSLSLSTKDLFFFNFVARSLKNSFEILSREKNMEYTSSNRTYR